MMADQNVDWTSNNGKICQNLMMLILRYQECFYYCFGFFNFFQISKIMKYRNNKTNKVCGFQATSYWHNHNRDTSKNPWCMYRKCF